MIALFLCFRKLIVVARRDAAIAQRDPSKKFAKGARPMRYEF